MTALHLLDPAWAGFDEAVGLAFGAIVDDEVVGQAVDHPTRAMRRVEHLGRTHARRAVMNDDPFPVTRRIRLTGHVSQNETSHRQSQQNGPAGRSYRTIYSRRPHRVLTHQPALSGFAPAVRRYRLPSRER